ncbi:peptide ABC transporter substrate-binding protein [Phenylobacterium sp. LjRoot225]|uniref:peptide ABC transporter substrate-binding protein n=1 Tax=Phenylobacterium sp. LjRoot225 TaxID=3342285 RepID=UPI003ED04AAC
MAPKPLRPFARLLLIAALALSACQDAPQRPACAAGKVCLQYGNDTEPATLDPSIAQLISEDLVIGDLMMGLTTEAADGKTIPGMAERWETSADGLTWTFHLQPALWSDGTPVTADDFVFAYRRILDPKTGSPYAYMVQILKNGAAATAGTAPPPAIGARALDARTLELRLEHPAPYLPQLLTHNSFYPVPAHVVRRHGDAWIQPGRHVSNGAYRLVSWRLGDRMTVEKNPRFFDAAHVCVDRIDYYPTPDYVAAERRVARGELDVTTQFQSNRLQHIREVMPGYARTHVWLMSAYMTFNTHDPGPFRDPRVRRALSESVDREFIARKLLRAGQLPAYGFVPPGTANAEPGPAAIWARKTFAARQAEARALLAQAGYGPDRPLKIELKTATLTDSLLLAQAVQADWRAVGVEVRTMQSEGQILFADLRSRNFQVALVSWIGDFNDPLTFLGLFQSSTGAQNYGDYKNPAYDALLAAADQEPDAKRRTALLGQAEQTMLNDDAIAPVYFGVSRSLVNPRVSGWVDNIQHRHRARWLCVKPGAAP